MKITRLKDHKLIKIASSVAREYMVKCHPTANSNDPRATKRESYGIEVFMASTDIATCIDQLYFSIDMLSGDRARKNSVAKMNRYDHLILGIENYYLRITSVYDRCLRHTNLIFQLGLPERQCRNETVKNNFHVKSNAVGKALTKLDRFINPFRRYRNTIAHEQTYTEKELNLLGGFYYLLEEDDSFKRFSNIYNVRANKFVSEKKSKFLEKLEKLENLVEEYFNFVQIPFEERLKTYT